MNSDEKTLSQLLHIAEPIPPFEISASDIVRSVSRRRKRGMAALSAALLLAALLAVFAVVIPLTRSNSTDAASQTVVEKGASARPSPTASRADHLPSWTIAIASSIGNDLPGGARASFLSADRLGLTTMGSSSCPNLPVRDKVDGVRRLTVYLRQDGQGCTLDDLTSTFVIHAPNNLWGKALDVTLVYPEGGRVRLSVPGRTGG
jgi:hypothetical protein